MPKRKTCCAGVAIAALLFIGAAALVAAEQAKAADPSSAAAAPAAGAVAKLDFDSPPRGEKSPITGKITGVDKPADYKLLILVSNDQKRWWDKTHISKSIPIESDGAFKIEKWVGDPHDLTVSYIGIWAVPASFDTTGKNYSVEGAPIPEKVTEIAVASQIKGREPSEQAKPAATMPAASKPQASKPEATTAPATSDVAVLGPGAVAGAVVDFEAPVLGSDAPITGKLSGVANPADYQVLILVSANLQRWWDKTHNVHGVPIGSDGTFTIKSWVVDPHDRTVANVGIWIVPKSFDTSWNAYQVEGKPLPDKVKQAAAAVKIQHRKTP